MTPKVAFQYHHIQDTPSALWTVVHNLGVYPIVDIFVQDGENLQKIIPAAVTYISATTCSVSFDYPITGIATVV